MKKININVVAAVCLVMAFSCSTSEPEKEPSQAPKAEVASAEMGTSVHVSLASAINDTHRYDSICKAIFGNDEVPIRAYTIRAADLLEALGMPESFVDSSICRFKHARVYLGLDSNKKFKLYFTPVVGAHLSTDSLIAGRDTILEVPSAGPDSRYVLDLNAPCPHTCDESSPLY